jgi:4-amino-4-deoxy-L-arabinose transferase-like glycosyltransferase
MLVFQRVLSSPWFKTLVFIALCAVFIFMNLSSFSLRIWDEAHLVRNAIEMNESGNYLVTTFDHKPDFWSAKPPLMIWLQVICLKFFGMSELSFRLPSAFAAVATCLALMWFVAKTGGSYYKGLLAVFILLTSTGYNSFHGIRTGDYDSLLTLFSVLYVICFYFYLTETTGYYLLLFFVFLTLAVLCKSIAGTLFLPSLLLYSVLKHRKALLRIHHYWQFYAGLTFFVCFGLGFFLLREYMNPGYLKAAVSNDMIKAVIYRQEEEEVGFFYYLSGLFTGRYTEWIYFLLISLVLGLSLKDKKERDSFVFFAWMLVPVLILLSVKQLKKEWYDLPLYPFFALTICSFLWMLLEKLGRTEIKTVLRIPMLPLQLVCCLLILLPPGIAMVNKVYIPDFIHHDHPICDESNYMILALRGEKKIDHYKYLDREYDADRWFYRRLLADKGIHVSAGDTSRLEAGDIVMVRNSLLRRALLRKYNLTPLDTFQNLYVYKVGVMLCVPGKPL